MTELEMQNLEAPLSLAELDKALKEANKKSAAGIDDFSMPVMVKCWEFLSIPLFNYANCCFAKGILTPNFRTPCIRLIPTKGNLEILKNWRPISLLSNLYKIISRAINNRMDKVMSRICSQAQKGFSKSRFA